VHPTDSGYSQLLIYVGALLVETWTYATTDITDLGAQINSTTTGSDLVSAAVAVSGVALTAVSASAFTGGANGTFLAADYATALTGVEGVAFNHIAFVNMTDTTVLASARAWIVNLNRTVRKAFLWTGGGSAESISTAVTRCRLSSTVPEVINYGGPNLVSIEDDSVTKSTAQFLGYIMGAIVGYSTRRTGTFARIPDWIAATRLSDTDVKAGIRGGVLMTTMDDDGLRIEEGITTYTVSADDEMPLEFYRDIRSVRIVHRIDMDMERFSRLYWIDVENNPNTQAAYQGLLLDYLQGLEKENVLKQGLSVVNLNPDEDNDGDTWYPTYYIARQKTIKRILAQGSVA
jgi:hypothetical protein